MAPLALNSSWSGHDAGALGIVLPGTAAEPPRFSVSINGVVAVYVLWMPHFWCGVMSSAQSRGAIGASCLRLLPVS